MAPVKCILALSGLDCCLFRGGVSAVGVDSLFYVSHFVCGCSVLVFVLICISLSPS